MKQISKRKIQVLGLLAVPAIAIALVAFLSGGLGGTSSPKASADQPHAGINFQIGIDAPSKDSDPANDVCLSNPTQPTKCTLSSGAAFDLVVYFNPGAALPGDIAGYASFDVLVTYAGVVPKDNTPKENHGELFDVNGNPFVPPQFEPDYFQWPPCANPAATDPPPANTIRWGCANASGADSVVYTGTMTHVPFNCTATGSITMKHGTADTSITVAGVTHAESNGTEVLNINCPTPTSTATITPTFTPTNTPTNTPTATPPPVPRWMKQQRYPFTNAPSQTCDPNAHPTPPCEDGPQDPPLDGLGNLWLTRQGDKIPPLNCVQSSDNAVFSEVLQFSPRVTDPKGVHQFSFIGGFEFEVRFDPKLICVNLIPGAAATDLGLVCFIDDKAQGQPLEGIARMGCVGKGKLKRFPVDFKTKGPELAQVWVKPQPELYSQIRPNQDNGVVAQLLDSNCELSDEQGHPIPLFSCEDAEVTIRYLEGDVEPNCKVDAADQQNVAFRWGVQLGSLLYNTRYDLEPSGTVKGDGDVDIKDLQFVFGRFNSTCGRHIDNNLPPALKSLPTDTIGSPHPRQAPRNAKS